MIIGGGNPAALQSNVTLRFSLTVTEVEGFVMKCGDTGKQIVFFVVYITCQYNDQHSLGKYYLVYVLLK